MPSPTTRIVNVRVLLFASYAERLGLESLRVALPALATVADALEHVRSLPGGERIPLIGVSGISVLGLADLAPDVNVRCTINKPDGSTIDFECTQTFSPEQIEWFKAGSALTIIRARRS